MNELFRWLPEVDFARFAVDAVWQSTLIGGGAILVIRSLKTRPAARSLVAVLACFLCAAAPLLTAIVRSQGLGLLAETNGESAAEVKRVDPAAATVGFELAPESAAFVPDTAIAAPGGMEEAGPAAAAASTDASATGSSASATASADSAMGTDVSEFSLRSLFYVVWMIAATCLTGRLLLSALAILHIWRESQACEHSVLVRSCRRAAGLLNLTSVPPVFICDRASCPAVIAWFRVRVIVPSVDTEHSEQHWVGVFAHELAHVQRRDGWSRLITEVAAILLPWQPLIWMLRREFATASEEACDDWAVFSGADPVDYAAMLMDWIPRKQPALALGFVGWPRIVRRRIERLLEDRYCAAPVVNKATAIVATTCSALLVAILAFTQPGRVFSAPAKPFAGEDGAERRLADGKLSTEPAILNHTVLTTLGDERLAHWNTARVAGFHDESGTLLSIGDDRTLVRWDLTTGERRQQLTLPASAYGRWRDWPKDVRARYATDEIVTPDGRHLIESMANGDIRLVNIAARRHTTLAHRVALPKKLAVSHDGSLLAVLHVPTENEDRVDLISLGTGQLVQSITRSFDHEDDDLRNDYWRGLALNHDGSRLATGRWEQLTVWDTATADASWTVRAEPAAPNAGNAGVLSFSSDGRLLACGERVRDAESGTVVTEFAILRRTMLAAPRSAASVAELNPAGSMLAVIGGRTLRMVDVRTGEELWRTEGPARDNFTSVKFLSDGALVATGCGHEILMWDAATGDRHGPAPERVRSLAANPVEGQLLLGTDSGQIQAVQTQTFETTHTADMHQHPVDDIVFNASGSFAASAAADSVALYDPVELRSRTVLENDSVPIRSRTPGLMPLAFSDDGTQLYTFPFRPQRSRNHLTRVSAVSGMQLAPLQMADSVFSYNGLEPAGRDELLMLSPDHRGAVSIWNSRNGKHVADLSRALPRMGGRVQVAVSRDGKRVACGVRAELIRLHDRATDTFIDLEKGHRPAALQALAFHPTGQVMASAAQDGRITLWNTATGKVIRKIKSGPEAGIIRDLGWTCDGSMLAALNGNGTVSVHGVSGIEFHATN